MFWIMLVGFLCCELTPANEMITDEDRLLCALFDNERQ